MIGDIRKLLRSQTGERKIEGVLSEFRVQCHLGGGKKRCQGSDTDVAGIV